MSSQAADRIVDLLEVLAAAPQPLTVAEAAVALEVHRSIVYRLLQTLAERKVVQRQADGRYSLGWRLMVMASSVSRDFQELVHAELAAVADRTRSSAFLAVESEGESQVLITAEPRNTDVHLSVRRLGYIGRNWSDPDGPPELAMLAGRPASGEEPPTVTAARARGYAVRESRHWPGLTVMATPIMTAPGYSAASISIIYSAGSINVEECAKVLMGAALTLSDYIISGRVELPFEARPAISA